MERGGCIYIMTNYEKTTYYVGVTSNLPGRIYEHRTNKYPKSFTARYRLKYCVFYEFLPTIIEAIEREKQVKKYRREKKEALVNTINPNWDDSWEVIKDW